MNKNQLKSVLILCCFNLLVACNSEDKKNPEAGTINSDVVKNPATASGDKPKTTDHVPVFQFSEEAHDFGTLKQGDIVSYAFKFKNSGQGDLIIRSATGSCGCTLPEYSKDPIAPGKDGIINVTFNSEGKEGMQNKTVTILANTIPNTKVLTITGKVVKK